MKIVFYKLPDPEKAKVKIALGSHELVFVDELLGDSPPPPDTEVLSVFTECEVTDKIISALPNLKLIATRSTGYDHIDCVSTQKHGILVTNVPVYGANTVAEQTFALLLALSRKIYQSVQRVRELGQFDSRGLTGFDLAGKILGVVGTGNIGQHVVKIANGFEMAILAYDPFPKTELASKYSFKYVTLEDLLANSDIVTLHVPYMPATHHIIGKAQFALMKPGSILVNTARGGLVETESLVEALRSGKLAGACLDVLEEEGAFRDEQDLLSSPHPNAEELRAVLADHALTHMDNVLVTPHNAFNTLEAEARILQTTISNIQEFIAGKPVNVVNSK